jgi:predicted nuclease of predicted toxin-antitoxin system
MGRRVKLDEDLPLSLADLLAIRDYEPATVLGQGWSGCKDPDLWPRLQAEKIFFITADKGFADLRVFPPGTHTGILLLRPDRESVLDFRTLLMAVLDRHSLDSLTGCTTVATPRSIRIRRPA